MRGHVVTFLVSLALDWRKSALSGGYWTLWGSSVLVMIPLHGGISHHMGPENHAVDPRDG